MHYRIFDLWRFIAAVLIMLYHFLYFAPYDLCRIFDLWRFIAAVLIMLYHFLYFAPYDLWRIVGPIAQRPTGLLDLFFMISGFLVMARYGGSMKRPRDALHLLRRRLAALYPLHLLTLFFFLPVAVAGAYGWISFHNEARWDLSALPMHLLLLHAWGTTAELGFNLPSWSISAEFFCYLAFPVIAFLHRRFGLAGLGVLLVGWMVLLELLWSAGVLGDRHWSRANLFGAYRALVGFLIGCMIADLTARYRLRVPHGLALAQLLVVSAVAAMLLAAPPLLPLALLSAALVCAAGAERDDPDLTQRLEPWRPLLATSLGIYLWHMVLAAICYQLLWKAVWPEGGVGAFLLFSIVPIAGTLLAAVLSLPLQSAAYRALAGTSLGDGGAPVATMGSRHERT